MVSVKAVVQGHLCVLLALQNTTVAVTAVVVELSTTILSVKLYLELLVMVFTLTMGALTAMLQHLRRDSVLKVTLTTCLTHAYTLENVAQVEPAPFIV
jgi:hypothetical protein